MKGCLTKTKDWLMVSVRPMNCAALVGDFGIVMLQEAKIMILSHNQPSNMKNVDRRRPNREL